MCKFWNLTKRNPMIKIGDKVIIIDKMTYSVNKQGDIGIITEIDTNDGTFRVSVEGRDNRGNWQNRNEFILIED
jgi:ATP-dependent exoDNAse (exonuclease V) alpha subunit